MSTASTPPDPRRPGEDPETDDTPPRQTVREAQEDEIDEAVEESFPASDPPSFVGSGGADRPRVPDPGLDDQAPGFGEDRDRTQGGGDGDPPRGDDRDRPPPASDDLALQADDAHRGPFRPSHPPPGEQAGFGEDVDGVAIDPVYRAATSEVDVYEDLPSRRARVDPGDEEEDEDTML